MCELVYLCRVISLVVKVLGKILGKKKKKGYVFKILGSKTGK